MSINLFTLAWNGYKLVHETVLGMAPPPFILATIKIMRNLQGVGSASEIGIRESKLLF